MNGKILVTDSLFIFDEHVKKLEAAGYEVERLDKPEATEEELCQAVKGKVGYILGGIEKITDKVIESADELKAIAFTGADTQFFIPGLDAATEKGIKVANAPGANSFAVAEFSMAVALSMQRNLYELSRTGSKKFETTSSLKESVVGVVGSGNIGSKIIKMVSAFEPSKVLYTSRTEKTNIKADFVDLDELTQKSDVIFVAVPKSAGVLFTKERLSKMKTNALIVSISVDVMDYSALLEFLKAGNLRAAIDWPAPLPGFNELPLSVWFNTNDHTAYNTHEANQTGSDMAVESLLNMLAGNKDQYQVN